MLQLEELKTERNLKDYADRNLKRKGKFYHCPVCGNNHKEATLSLDGNLFKCFYGTCDAAGSLIDLIMVTEHKDAKEAVKRARELYDPTYDRNWTPPKRTGQQGKTNTQKTTAPAMKEGAANMAENNEQQEIKRDFRNYFKKCRKRIHETDYPRKRGLDEETVKRFKLGYDPKWTSPTAEYNRKQENKEIEKENRQLEKDGLPPLPYKPPAAPSPRLIIPLSANNYLARDTRPDSMLNDYQKKRKKMNEGKDKPFFNLQAVKNPLCFFVTEGEINAMSIEQAGGSCVALGTTAKAKGFGEYLKTLDPVETGTVIICMDNDPAGKEAKEKIVSACEIAGMNFILEDVNGPYNDANDYLVADRQGFYAKVQEIINGVRAEKLDEYDAQTSAKQVAAEFMERPEDAGEAIPTGFKKLDAFLDGGLPSGLVFIGGLSSLGKTTLALNIAETIATNKYPEGTQEFIQGRDVLYFALEQSKFDLMSKILSRRTYLLSQQHNEGEKWARTNIQLMRRKLWNGDGDGSDFFGDGGKTIWEAYEWFLLHVGDNLRIIASAGDFTAADIVRMTEKHIAFTGRVPVVFVDYLQILKPVDQHMTDKQAVDRTIVMLAQLAKRHDTTVIGISSFNRESYWTKVSMTAFKDSGNLEYSAEVLFAIAPAKIEDAATDKEKTENKNVVEQCREDKDKQLKLHVLKNKSGKVTGKKTELLFTYHSWFNHFEETEGPSYLSRFDNGNPASIII